MIRRAYLFPFNVLGFSVALADDILGAVYRRVR